MKGRFDGCLPGSGRFGGQQWQRLVSGLGAWAVMIGAACPILAAEAPESAPIDKIGFDMSQLDENGLYGPTDGKRALDYEFCIPQGNAYAEQVRAIDSTVRFYPNSSGRVGCCDGQVLTIGSTHQSEATMVLVELANLDYVERIEPTYWE